MNDRAIATTNLESLAAPLWMSISKAANLWMVRQELLKRTYAYRLFAIESSADTVAQKVGSLFATTLRSVYQELRIRAEIMRSLGFRAQVSKSVRD